MEIHLDITTVPPGVVLKDPDNFRDFKIVLVAARHARVSTAVLEQLAGDRLAAPQWRENLSKMIGYAASAGYLDEQGIRAHIEVRDPD